MIRLFERYLLLKTVYANPFLPEKKKIIVDAIKNRD